MPYPLLFMTASGTTSSTNTVAGVVVALASLGAVIQGFTSYYATIEAEKNQKNAREKAHRARYARDRYVREHANQTAQFLNSEAPRLIASIQNTQRQFSELITELASTLHQGEQSSIGLQNLIPLVINHLSHLTTLTAQFESEMPTSHNRLANLTAQLTIASNAFTHNQDNLSQAVEEISQVSSQLRQAAELIRLKSTKNPTQEIIQLKQQNRDYKTYIERLIARVEEQSNIINDLEKKLEETQRAHRPGEQVLKKSSINLASERSLFHATSLS